MFKIGENSKHPLALFFVLSGFVLFGCSQPSSREHIDAVRGSAHPHNAAIGMDDFWMDNRSPADRPVQHWEFYYKHCLVDEFKPYPNHIEFVCTGPF